VTWPRGLLLVLGLAYLASGWYVVGGDEQAAVRRFGRAVRPLRTSGLHYDWPWPWCRVERVKLTAVRTLTVGDAPSADETLMPATAARVPAYLTGDKNVLLLRASVQYRLQPERLEDFLYGQADGAQRLRLLVESELTETASRCGVDYLQTFGFAELNQRFTQHLRAEVELAKLGLEIDQVTLDRVQPPARVQAEFLDVANARAEAARAVHDARTYSEQRVAAGNSDAAQQQQQAEQARLARVARAQGSAARFERLVAQLEADARQSGRAYADSRALAMQRLTLDTLQQALARVTRRVIVDAQEPVDLNVQGGSLR
jgi:membrane protease subunit HflK